MPEKLTFPSKVNPDSDTNPGLITGVPEHLKEVSKITPVEENFKYDDPDDDPMGLWAYTVDIKRAGEAHKGRSHIGRDTPIDGGVYYGTYGGEAIVVDTAKYPEQYEKLLTEVLQKSQDSKGEVRRGKILESVFDTVKEKIQYSQAGVDKILSDIGDGEFKDGTKVDLGDFIEGGVGVCRHQALAVGALLERLIKNGQIRGKVSVDRSMQYNPNGEKEGHAWVRYTGSTGDIVILDVAQNKLILLEDADPKEGWNYLRPEEQKTLASKLVGPTAVTKTVEDSKPPGKTIEKIEDEIEELKTVLSGSDQRNLDLYVTGLMDKADAQNAGNGHLSTESGQSAGRAYLELSADAKKIAPHYHRLMSLLERAIEKSET